MSLNLTSITFSQINKFASNSSSDIFNSNTITNIAEAINQNDPSAIMELLRNAKVDQHSKEGIKILNETFVWACSNGYDNILELLTELSKTNHNLISANSCESAFMAACANGHLKIIKLLLKDTSPANLYPAINLYLAIINAFINNNLDIIKLIIHDPRITLAQVIEQISNNCFGYNTNSLKTIIDQEKARRSLLTSTTSSTERKF